MGNTFSKLLGLITIPIIARALGSEGYGQFNLTLVTLGYIALLVDFGSTAYGVKECAKEPDASEIVNKILSARLTYVLFSVVVSIPVVFLLFRNPPGMVYVVFIGYIYVLAMGLNIDFFYFGKGNMLIPTMGQLTGQILYVLAVFFFISKKSDLPLLVFFLPLLFIGRNNRHRFFCKKTQNTHCYFPESGPGNTERNLSPGDFRAFGNVP